MFAAYVCLFVHMFISAYVCLRMFAYVCLCLLLYGRRELYKIACKILRLPATSAAVEQSFSCYSNVYTAKQNILSNKRAAKVEFVSQNINFEKQIQQITSTTNSSNTQLSYYICCE